jgi:hypothetical protein
MRRNFHVAISACRALKSRTPQFIALKSNRTRLGELLFVVRDRVLVAIERPNLNFGALSVVP